MAEFASWSSYWIFRRTVSRELRYVWSDDIQHFLDAVLKTSASRVAQIDEGQLLWRSQLGHDWRLEGDGDLSNEVPCAFAKERMKPLRHCASDGRANARGIPCLYLSCEKETAIAEVRPWMGSLVSVGQFRVTRQPKIIDCAQDYDKLPLYLEEPDSAERTRAVWANIDRAFSEPMTRADDSADYVPTQIIAELFKREGFDGIGYRSRLGGGGFNVALFNLDDADLVNCGLYGIKNINFDFSVEDYTCHVRPSAVST